VTLSAGEDVETELVKRLQGVQRLAVVGIGDELHPADRLGILAARAIEAMVLPGVHVFLAGTVPESMTAPIRRYRPDHILLLDAAEMGRPPGTFAVLGADAVQGMGLSTHALPLTVMMDYLEKDVGSRVTLVGIQPDTSGARTEPTPVEMHAISRLVTCIRRSRSAPSSHEPPSIPKGDE